MLELKKVCKSYPIREGKSQQVLKNLSATFPSKGFVTLLGASGNGKTTVLNILGGLDAPDSGEVYFNNEKIEDFESFRRERVSFIFQELNLIPHLNALDNVILGISDEIKNKKEKARDILLSLGLEESLYKRPDQLSGGQQQRVAIARTIAKNVDIIICDEPTGSLDNDTKKIISDILKDLSKTKLVIFITHNLNLANEYSDMIFETVDGQILDHSHLVKRDASQASVEERRYDSNVMWLAFKNIIGRYKHSIRYSLFIIFIMLIAAASIIIQGEYVKKYMHDISLDTGIKSVRIDYERSDGRQGFYNDLSSMDNVESIAYIYNTQIRLTAGRLVLNPKLISTDLIEIRDDKYFEELLVAGRLPEASDEVMMTSNAVINMLFELGLGGKRLRDQYATGELDANEVFDLVDLSSFTVFEQNWPKFKIVGIIDGSRIYEGQQTMYIKEGFTDLFDYTTSDRPAYLDIPKHLMLNRIILYKDNVYREEHEELTGALEEAGYQVDTFHERRVQVTYNQIDSFFRLSVVFLYVIIAIAAISFISFLTSSIFERRYEVGLYRTKGYTKKNIMKILGYEMYFLGLVSSIVSIVILLITAFIMYMRIDYIESLSHVFDIVNIPMLSLILLGIVTVFVAIIIYISNTVILRESVLSNIKAAGFNKRTIRKQVAIALVALSVIGGLQIAITHINDMGYFRRDTIDASLYDDRDDYSNVDLSGIFEVFSQEELEKDLELLTGKLYIHTHLNTDYDTYLRAHEHAKEQIFDKMTKLEYMRLIKPFVASLNCVSTDLTFNDDLEQVKMFADRIHVSDGKMYLIDNTFYQKIPKGSQITYINGRHVSEIIEKMFSGISSTDEYDAYKHFCVNTEFAFNYLTSVEYAEEFSIRYISPDGESKIATVPAVGYHEIKSEITTEDLFSQEFHDTYGLLSIHSFEPLHGEVNQSIAFIDDFFKGLKERELGYLILDLRGNGSGDVRIATHLLSYLQSEPGQFLSTDVTDIDMAENNFEGMILILQDGGTCSIAGQMLASLQDKGIGYRIGQEASSASFASTEMDRFSLASTDIVLSFTTEISNAHTKEIDESKVLAADYNLVPGVENVMNNQDIVMNLATHIVDRELAIDDFSAMDPVGLFETFTKNELMEDFKKLKTIVMNQTHLFSDEIPILDLIDTAEDKIVDGMTKIEFMRIVQPIAVSMRAHNTKVLSHDLIDNVKLFADDIYAEEDKLYLSNNTFYEDIPVGSQIMSINGRASSEIIELIFASLPSDGKNLTHKYYLLNEDFGTNYFMYVEYLGYFDIEYISPDGVHESISVPGIESKTIADKHRLNNSKTESFIQEFHENYAIMKLKAFSPLDIERIDGFFESIKDKGLNYVILDLRGNVGGEFIVTEHLLSYLLPNHPSKPEYAYQGELFVLQDGSVVDTAAQCLSMLKAQSPGLLIGDESAGSSTIPASVASVELDNTALILNYSTEISKVDIPDENPEKGVMPDVLVLSNIEDIIIQKDTPLEYAMETIELMMFYGEFYNRNMTGLFQVYSEEALTEDFDLLVDTLRNQHTNLFTNEETFNGLAATVRNELHDNMTKIEFIRLVSPLVASVNCFQTNLSVSVVNEKAKSLGGAGSKNVYDSNIRVFADKIKISEGKLYLYSNTFYHDVPIGSEIVSINGKPSAEIIDTMTQFVSSDGENETSKYNVLNGNFSWYYFLYVENTHKFLVDYIQPDGAMISQSFQAVNLNDIAKMDTGMRISDDPITFTVNEDYGYLDINSFALYTPVKQKNFRYALYDFFAEVRVKGIDHVILDLRGNYGGNAALAAKLLTYLQPVPHPYWSDRSADNSELSSPLVTSNINFTGNLYVLIDGESTSTTGHVAALLKYHDIATFIGQESGSSYINSEKLRSRNLTNTGIHFVYSTEVFEVGTPGLAIGKGIKPDYVVVPTIDDLIVGRDPVLDYAVRLIDR